jgi:hypothetical protein
MALPSRASLDDWSAEITEDAVTQMNGVISIIDPNTEQSTPYVPEADTGNTSTPATVLDHRRARIAQLIRPPSDASGGQEWSTRTRMRFQVDLLPGDPTITKGMIVIVNDGGKDHALESFTYEVTRAINSSHAALRSIDATSELGKVGA